MKIELRNVTRGLDGMPITRYFYFLPVLAYVNDEPLDEEWLYFGWLNILLAIRIKPKND